MEIKDKTEKLLEEPKTDSIPVGQSEKPATYIPCCGICSPKYFRQFFNVKTSEVMLKLFYGLTIVFYKNFKEVGPNKIDMYGPFWIYATMVMSLAISQNIYSFLSRPEHSKFQYTIEYVPQAFMIVFLFGLMIPIVFNVIIRAFGGSIRYSHAISIYGYSQTINIIALILCCYPNASWQNFFITCGAFHSSIFLYLCLKRELVNQQGSLMYIAIFTLIVCQLVLIIFYKKFFFGNFYTANNNYYEV